MACMQHVRLTVDTLHSSVTGSIRPCPFTTRPTGSSSSTRAAAQQRANAPSCSYAVVPRTFSEQQMGRPCRHVARAGSMDVMPVWTLDQIAGLVFGGVMLASVLSYRQVDVFIAKQQRKQLGLCQECGGLYDAPTCTQKNCPLKQQQVAAQQSNQQ